MKVLRATIARGLFGQITHTHMQTRTDLLSQFTGGIESGTHESSPT